MRRHAKKFTGNVLTLYYRTIENINYEKSCTV